MARASDEICKGDDSIDCRNHYTARRMDGKCNNFKNKATRDWGASATGMRRMAAPDYGTPGSRDLHSPRKVETWGAVDVIWYLFPHQVNVSPRKVSNEMHNTEGKTTPGSKGFTHMTMQFGQFLAHDIALTPEGGIVDFWQINVF